MERQWNDDHEEYLKNIAEQSISYTWMQEQTAMYYTMLDRRLGIVIIILSGIVGTNNFIATELDTRNIIFGAIAYLTAILGSILQFLKPQEVSQQRTNIANKFRDIYYDVKQELTKVRDYRDPPTDYMKMITQRFIELYDFSPTISNYIINRFKQHFKGQNIQMPLNTDSIYKIKINSNLYTNNSNEEENKNKHRNPLTNTEFWKYTHGRLNNVVIQ